MIGMYGYILENNQLVNSIQIKKEVKAGEKYLVHFLGDPQFVRVVQIEEIQSWLLFPDQNMANIWLAKNLKQAEPPPEPPPEPRLEAWQQLIDTRTQEPEEPTEPEESKELEEEKSDAATDES